MADILPTQAIKNKVCNGLISACSTDMENLKKLDYEYSQMALPFPTNSSTMLQFRPR